MICKICGSEVDVEHGCLSCEELIVPKFSENTSEQMQSMLLSTKNQDKMNREEITVVGFGVAIAVFLVSISVMSAII